VGVFLNQTLNFLQSIQREGVILNPQIEKSLIESSIVIGKTKKGGSHSPTLPTMEIEPLAILSKRVVDIKSEKPEQLSEFEKYIEGVESPS
jgi:hypothetical protein